MHVFLVDETNRDYKPGRFFIVGGLVFTEEQVELVDAAVRECRLGAGFRAGDSFKFDTNSRPSHVSIENHRDAKRTLIHRLNEIGVRMIVSVVLHDLAARHDYGTRMEWALNTVAGAYRKLLHTERATGVMLMDRDNDRFDHLEHLFQHGLRMGEDAHVDVSDRIRLFGMTSDNASNLSSAADVSLGAFRYCVNTAVGAGREPVAREMFPALARIMWSGPENGVQRVRGFGYHPRPEASRIRAPRLRERYEALSNALAQYAIDPLDARQ